MDPSYLQVKIDGLPIPKGRLVKGQYKLICRDCAMYFSTTVHLIDWVQSTKDFRIGTTMARNWLTRLGWISTINFMTMVTILHNQHFSDFSPNVDIEWGPPQKKDLGQDTSGYTFIYIPYHKPSSNKRVPSRGYADTSTSIYW